MRKKVGNLIAIGSILLGIGIILYPTISDYWNYRHQTSAIADYTQGMASLDTVDYESLLSEAEAYNRTLKKMVGRLTPNQEEYETYEKLLDPFGTGMMGHITIPKIGVSLPIYHGTSEGVLQIGVGHVVGSSLPVGGEGTHTVLSGHRGLISSKLFTDLDKLEIGDRFQIQVLDETLIYQVDKISVVEPKDQEVLEIEDGKDYCSLVTCTPYGINTHRLVVRGCRVEETEGEPLETVNHFRLRGSVVIILVVVAGFLMLLAGIIIRKRRKGDGKYG
jgi:sortase A